MEKIKGACLCGRVQVWVEGDPTRVGICHCTDCRQESGSAFTFFAVWPIARFDSEGETATCAGRSFCPACGARLYALSASEAEVKLGILEIAPTPFVPTYELWVKRREPWLPPLRGARQYQEDKR
jgi:hypothetical protein